MKKLIILLRDSGDETTLMMLLGGVAVLVLLFLFLREVILWYYKINERVVLLQEMNENLRILIKLKGGVPAEKKTKKDKEETT